MAVMICCGYLFELLGRDSSLICSKLINQIFVYNSVVYIYINTRRTN
jgi:hypothetical protein